MTDPTPLWRRMHSAAAEANPLDTSGYVAMLQAIAAELARRRCGAAAQFLLDEAR